MIRSRSRGLSLGIIGLLIILGGVTLSVLTYFAFSALRDGYQKPPSMETIFSDDDDDDWAKVKDYSDSAAWAYGFVYIVPGIIFLMAALIQHKAGYIVSSIIGLLGVIILCIIVLAAGILVIGLIVTIGNVKEDCEDTMAGCKCSFNSGEEDIMPFKECHYISELAGYCIGMMVCIILSWILMLIASILAIVYSCRSNETQPGMVYTNLQEDVFVTVPGQPQPYPQPIYAQGGAAFPYYNGPSSQPQIPLEMSKGQTPAPTSTMA